MQYFVSKSFEKQFKKLPKNTKQQTTERLHLFVRNPVEYRLHNYPLVGVWAGYRSINITGDVRAVYREVAAGVARFDAIGSHSELYG